MQKLVETETKNLQSISKTLSEQEDRKNTLSDQIPLVQKVIVLMRFSTRHARYAPLKVCLSPRLSAIHVT